MCDYSLMALPNRLAVCGEELVVHRFSLGSVGLTSPSELKQPEPKPEPQRDSFFEKLKKFLSPPVVPQCCAVCVPPGTRLLVRDFSKPLQRALALSGPEQEVTFTQINTVGFRDAIRFESGVELLLQKLNEGQRVQVLSLTSSEERKPLEPEFVEI